MYEDYLPHVHFWDVAGRLVSGHAANGAGVWIAYKRLTGNSRGTFPILSRDPSFQETIKNLGKQIQLLKRSMVERNRESTKIDC